MATSNRDIIEEPIQTSACSMNEQSTTASEMRMNRLIHAGAFARAAFRQMNDLRSAVRGGVNQTHARRRVMRV